MKKNAMKPDQLNMNLDENENCITMFVHKNTDGGYDIDLNERNNKGAQETVHKHSSENNFDTVNVSIGQEESCKTSITPDWANTTV